jgi:hypothetical protein
MDPKLAAQFAQLMANPNVANAVFKSNQQLNSVGTKNPLDTSEGGLGGFATGGLPKDKGGKGGQGVADNGKKNGGGPTQIVPDVGSITN